MPIREIPPVDDLVTFDPVWAARYAEQLVNDLDEWRYFALRQTGFYPPDSQPAGQPGARWPDPHNVSVSPPSFGVS